MRLLLTFFPGALTFLFFTQCNEPLQKKKELLNAEVVKDSCSKKEKTDSLVAKTELALTSEITCPKCGFKKTETLPTDVCVIKYTCQKCGEVLHPKEGDCCVFCTYGDHMCPSKQ